MEPKKSSQHESLTGSSSQIIRQNRIESEGEFFIIYKELKYKVSNYSLFGIGFSSEKEFKIGEYLENISLHYGEQTISENSFNVKRCKKGDFGFEIGLEIIDGTLPIETIMRLKDFNSLVSALDEKKHKYRVLPDQFKISILDLASRLEAFEKYVQEFTKKEFSKSRDYTEARESLIETVGSQIKNEINEITLKLKSELGEITDEKIKSSLSFFQNALGKYIYQSPFTKRSFEKPRGYAGDFEMMSQIYANDAFSNSLFGSCMEKAVQSFSEPAAVRNRSKYLAEKIIKTIKSTNGTLKFLSVASGPAEEVKIILPDLSQADLDRCTFYLLDQDEGALQFAQKNIKEIALKNNKNINLQFMNRGIKEVISYGLNDEKFNLIYSAGLFDYFTDPIATKACKQLYNSLNDKSELIIGNFNIATTNWFGMLALFDWSLILRSEADLIRIFKFCEKNLNIERESNNINLFCSIKN